MISEQLGVEPVFINSALVSAQNRQRYYWANWDFMAPADRNIMLADIIERPPTSVTIMSDTFSARQQGRKCKDKAVSFSSMEYVKNGRQGDYLECDNDGKCVVFNDRVKGVTENDRGYRYNKEIRQSLGLVSLAEY